MFSQANGAEQLDSLVVTQLTVDKKGKSKKCVLCLYGKPKVQIQTWVFDVRLYAFFFVCQFRARE